jgi:hypothetical protein
VWRRLVLVAIAGVASACGGSDGVPDCPDDAAECPSGCFAVPAFPYDAANACVASSAQTVACTNDPGAAGDVVCVRRGRDGTIFLGAAGPLFEGRPGWMPCGDAVLASTVVSAPACAAAGGP